MNSISVKDICKYTGGTLLFDESTLYLDAVERQMIDTVIIDSRQGAEQTLFVPFIGENHDAHDFIPDVYRRGTRVCFTCISVLMIPWKHCKDSEWLSVRTITGK